MRMVAVAAVAVMLAHVLNVGARVRAFLHAYAPGILVCVCVRVLCVCVSVFQSNVGVWMCICHCPACVRARTRVCVRG